MTIESHMPFFLTGNEKEERAPSLIVAKMFEEENPYDPLANIKISYKCLVERNVDVRHRQMMNIGTEISSYTELIILEEMIKLFLPWKHSALHKLYLERIQKRALEIYTGNAEDYNTKLSPQGSTNEQAKKNVLGEISDNTRESATG